MNNSIACKTVLMATFPGGICRTTSYISENVDMGHHSFGSNKGAGYAIGGVSRGYG